LSHPHLPAFGRPALWLGLSLSAVALIYEWATALGLPLGAPALALLAAACGLGVSWRVWTDHRPPTTDNRTIGARDRWSVVGGRWSLALLAILALTLWTRFYQIRDLALPNWVDSLHHALMIRIAAERGQAPVALTPYMPVEQIPYHWGYHVFV